MSVGIGWRPEIAADLLARPGLVDHVEVTAEACTTEEALREGRAIGEVWPTLVHGVKLSLGSAEGIDPERARKLGRIARELRAPLVSEHVAFVAAGGREIGHLTAVPYTRETVAVLASNVTEARRHLPDVPLLLENVAWSFRWPEDAIEEGAFFHEVVAATGCELLLDVSNLYANARNAGRDPLELLSRYPLDRVAAVHVAGGVEEHGFYYDTHGHAIPVDAFDLVARVLAVRDVPVIVERDSNFPAFDELARELEALRGVPACPARPFEGLRVSGEAGWAATRVDALAARQRELARVLTSDEPARILDAPSLERARSVLRAKRADDALPLLPTLAAFGERVRALALACLERAPRPDEHVAIADALRIAERAARESELADAARADALVLRARFVGPDPDGDVRRRVAPYVARERLARGTRWVVKGFGASAPVRVLERWRRR